MAEVVTTFIFYKGLQRTQQATVLIYVNNTATD